MSFLDRLLQGFRSFVLGDELLSGEEGRSHPRIVCHYEVNLKNLNSEFDAEITDIGISGMRIEGGPLLKRGERFKISYPFAEGFREEHAFEVEVMWCRRRADNRRLVSGVAYVKQGELLHGTWVHTLLTEVGLLGDAVYQRRSPSRQRPSHQVALCSARGGRPLGRGHLNNLSVGGALVECHESFQLPKGVLLVIGEDQQKPTLTLRCRVIETRKDPDDGQSLVSLQFVDFNREEFKALQRLIQATI